MYITIKNVIIFDIVDRHSPGVSGLIIIIGLRLDHLSSASGNSDPSVRYARAISDDSFKSYSFCENSFTALGSSDPREVRLEL